MYRPLAALLDRLDDGAATEADVIQWSAPIPSFGDPDRARIATLGLNPSNREFLDDHGEELAGSARRFHTLRSLGLSSWADAEAAHLAQIVDSCQSYFTGNPYDTWFRKLDRLLSGTGCSYYAEDRSACHLDLIPYATAAKWSGLSRRQRTILIRIAGDTLGCLLRDSSVDFLVLNGTTVVNGFEELIGESLQEERADGWSLSRSQSPAVQGRAYRGSISRVGDVELGRVIHVFGFNHNIQSSFGVTLEAMDAIRAAVEAAYREALHEQEGA